MLHSMRRCRNQHEEPDLIHGRITVGSTAISPFCVEYHRVGTQRASMKVTFTRFVHRRMFCCWLLFCKFLYPVFCNLMMRYRAKAAAFVTRSHQICANQAPLMQFSMSAFLSWRGHWDRRKQVLRTTKSVISLFEGIVTSNLDRCQDNSWLSQTRNGCGVGHNDGDWDYWAVLSDHGLFKNLQSPHSSSVSQFQRHLSYPLEFREVQRWSPWFYADLV